LTKVTIKDIAKKLGVSATTVSKVINNHPDISAKTRKIVQDTIEKMGYIPNFTAQNLRKNVTKFIGLVISDNTNPYYAEVIKAVEKVIKDKNYHTIIFNNEENPEKELKFIKELLSINVAGVIISPARGNKKSIKILEKYEIPFVLCNRYIKKDENNYVIANDFKAGYIATNHLLKNRSKKIIFLNGFKGISCARDRLEGYKTALRENNLPIVRNRLYYDIIDHDNGYKITKKVLQEHKPPFSILCISDHVATGAIRRLLEKKIKIPEEISVMGIDNVQNSYYSFSVPSLTTVDIPQYMVGFKSASILFDLIENPIENNQGIRIVFEPKLVVRGSA
jgi:DNA-binding LacI/PurR family transcriptional regulator